MLPGKRLPDRKSFAEIFGKQTDITIRAAGKVLQEEGGSLSRFLQRFTDRVEDLREFGHQRNGIGKRIFIGCFGFGILFFQKIKRLLDPLRQRKGPVL